MEKLEYQHEAGSEPISGYRLLEPLGQGGFAEVWKCTAPGGLLKAIKFVHGGCHILDTNAPAEEELRAVERVKAIRHPFMLMMERVEIVRGELVIVMELADQSLADLLEVERKQGKQGIPRDPLLIYLREAAELLDVMNTHYGLQHLDIKPRNLFLVSNHVKIGDFGLVSSLSATNKDMGLGAITPLYASPEVFQGSISNQSDQYSLAIVFMELLVGKLPFTGKNARQLLLQHLTEEPDLSSLPEKDRTIIARALSKNPIDRYPSCTDLIQALILGQSEVVSSRTVFFPEIQEIQQRQNDSKRIQISRVKQLTPTQLRKLPSLNIGVEFDRMEIVDLVSKTPLTEIFRARTPDGFPRLVKILFSCPPPGDPGVRRLEEMRHPCLQPMEIMEHKPGRLVISCPVSDCNLRDVLATCHSNGYKGIPRIQLLEYLRSAAEGLQFLQKKYDLYHLSLNPRNLVLDGDRLQMAEFGILQQVWLPTGQVLGPLNPRYSAPELNQNRVNPSCDQYSLAICYHELLVGRLPKMRGGLSAYHLDLLPEPDRPIIERALHPDPNRRWPSIMEMINALDAAGTQVADGRGKKSLDNLANAPGDQSLSSEHMQTRFQTLLAEEVILQRLEIFRSQWRAAELKNGPPEFLFSVPVAPKFWQRLIGREPRLEIAFHMEPIVEPDPGVKKPTRISVIMDLYPRDCTKSQGADLIKEYGASLVESMRTHLQINQYGRDQERIPWHHPIQVAFLLSDGSTGDYVEAQGKDISMNGIGFYLPGQMPSSQVMLQIPKTPQTPATSIMARVVRAQGCGAGWYEVGAILMPPDELPPESED